MNRTFFLYLPFLLAFTSIGIHLQSRSETLEPAVPISTECINTARKVVESEVEYISTKNALTTTYISKGQPIVMKNRIDFHYKRLLDITPNGNRNSSESNEYLTYVITVAMNDAHESETDPCKIVSVELK